MKRCVIYLNGRFVEKGEAAVSPFNRGLLYGDGLFETMRSYGGKVFALDRHLARLGASARFLRIDVPFGAAEVEEILEELLDRNYLADGDGRIRLNLIRGRGAGGLLPDGESGTEVMITAEGVPGGLESIRREGIALALITALRVDAGSPLARHKTLHYLPSVLGLMEARDRGGDEGLFLNNLGNVCEGTTSNIFIVKDGLLKTPPLSAGILPGITRAVVLESAPRLGIRAVEGDVTVEELFGADEIFTTGSVKEVVPVIRVDEKRYPIGPVTRKIQNDYRRSVAEYVAGREWRKRT